MSFLRSKFALFLLILTALSGCSLQPPKGSLIDEQWSFRGKMAVRNPTEASSFNVQWLQQGDTFQIELSGPLGQGEVFISGQPGDVTLKQGDTVVQSNSLTSLVYEATSLELPLDYLQYWVRALPSPGTPYELTKNDQGQISTIAQSGWEVAITEYFEETSAYPRKLSFAKATDSGKLIIREWNTF